MTFEDYDVQWYPGMDGAWVFLTLSYSSTKTPKKPQPGKLTRPGIEPGPATWEATMLPLDRSGGVNRELCASRKLLNVNRFWTETPTYIIIHASYITLNDWLLVRSKINNNSNEENLPADLRSQLMERDWAFLCTLICEKGSLVQSLVQTMSC